jgi:hypothetical protein
MSDGDNQLSNLSDRIESLLGPKAHAKRLAGTEIQKSQIKAFLELTGNKEILCST